MMRITWWSIFLLQYHLISDNYKTGDRTGSLYRHAEIRISSDWPTSMANIHPLVVKIAPDLEMPQIDSIAALLMKHEIDGVIATNTTLSRARRRNAAPCKEARRIKRCAPAETRSLEVIRRLNACPSRHTAHYRHGRHHGTADAEGKKSRRERA